MKIVAIIAFSFLPALLWGLFISKKENLSAKPLVTIVIFSFLSIVLALVIQAFADYFFASKIESAFTILYDSFFLSSFIEELAKSLAFFIFVKFLWSNKLTQLDENLPGDMRAQVRTLLLLSVLYGFIFASIENFAYAIKIGYVVLVRLVTANFLHASFGVYYLEISMGQKLKKKIHPFILVWILHGLYNMFLALGSVFVFFSVMIVIFSIVNAIKQYEKFKEN